MSMPRVFSFAYCSEDVKFPEDICGHKFLNNGTLNAFVADGCGAFHSPSCPRRLINGLSDAQHIGRILQCRFTEAALNEKMEEILIDANRRIADWGRSIDLPVDKQEPDNLPGLDVAAVQITPLSVELIQMGDVLLFWEMKSGETGGTPNLGQTFEQTVGPQLRLYKEKFGGEEAWNHIEDLFRQARRQYVNNPHEPEAEVMLNGQSAVPELWARIELPRDTMSLLLLVNDGLFNEDDSFQDLEALAAKMCKLYRKGGWSTIFHAKGSPKSGEGAGIAIEFV